MNPGPKILAEPGPARSNIQVSVHVREQLGKLAEAYQRDEQLPRRPTMDDVIRRLLAARERLAAAIDQVTRQDGGRA